MPAPKRLEPHSGDQTRQGPRVTDYDGAAEYLGMSRRFVERERAAGRLAAVKLGRATRFEFAELDRYVAERCEASA